MTKCSFVCSTVINGTEVKPRNPVFKKHRCTKMFQTVNQAKIVWDPRCKPKGQFSGHLNFRSICNKHEQLEHLLLESNIDCLGISESWLKQSSPSTLVSMAGYNVFSKDRLKGKGGGVLLYVRNTFTCREIALPANIEFDCVGVEITLSEEMSLKS